MKHKLAVVCLLALSSSFSIASSGEDVAEVRLENSQPALELIENAEVNLEKMDQILRADSSGNLSKGRVDQDSMYNYVTDYCDMVDNSVSNEDTLRAQNLRRCEDGTASFVQPESEGWKGYEGKCGQTAASNSLFMLCQVAAHPKRYADYYLSDVTPGVRPGTLESGLDQMFDRNRSNCPTGGWSVDDASNQEDFWDNVEDGLTVRYSVDKVMLRKRADGTKVYRKPVIAMIRVPGALTLHWVTIVDLLNKDEPSCKVVINHWDDQFEVPCYNFARWSYGVDESYGPVLSGYVTVRF